MQESKTDFKTDIQADSWILERLPERFHAYAMLARLDRPIGAWLLALPGWWAILLASQGPSFKAVWLIVLFGIGAVVMRGAGCIINDIWDRDLDKKVERTRVRPLASGALSVKQALKFLMILLFIGLIVLVQMNVMTVMLGLISIPLVIAYPLMKRVTWWPQAFLGLTFNFGILMGWSAVAEHMTGATLCLYLGAILWTIGYDTIYAHQDKEDDLIVGIKSTAIKFGDKAKLCVSSIYALAFLLMLAGFMSLKLIYGPLLIPLGLHLIYQIKRWDLEEPDTALEVFKSNRDAGLLLLMAAALTLFF